VENGECLGGISERVVSKVRGWGGKKMGVATFVKNGKERFHKLGEER